MEIYPKYVMIHQFAGRPNHINGCRNQTPRWSTADYVETNEKKVHYNYDLYSVDETGALSAYPVLSCVDSSD
jgi:hypothetical protein